jgi:probable HAF family extracellular repeat protein
MNVRSAPLQRSCALLGVCGAAILLLSAVSHAQPPTIFSPRYRVIDLGVPPGAVASAAVAINNSGQVVGYANDSSGAPRAFIWSRTTGIQELGTLGGNTSVATGINSAGHVTGYSTTASGETHAFFWSGGLMHDLGMLGLPGVTFSAARAIDDQDLVVGNSGAHAFSWSPHTGVMIELGTATNSIAYAVRGGYIAGSFGFLPFVSNQFPVTAAAIIGGGIGGSARGVNDFQHVTGCADFGSTSSAFIYRPGANPPTMIDLGNVGPPFAFVTLHGCGEGINNWDQIVGWSSEFRGEAPAIVRGFVYSGGRMFELSRQLEFPLQWQITVGRAINDSGQIAAQGILGNRHHALLLDPIPEVPTVRTHPIDAARHVGIQATFTATALAIPYPTIQWQISREGGIAWSDLPGATSSSYTIIPSLADSGTRFRAVFTSALGSAVSEVAELRVSATAGATADVDADGSSDLVIWRPSDGNWYTQSSTPNVSDQSANAHQWGAAGDVPLTGDIDGDGIADLIIWRPGTGTWFWLISSTGYAYASAGTKQWGNQSLGDVPMVADLDGDGLVELIVWRASTGTWFWLTSATGYDHARSRNRQWGNHARGDVPLIADLDGDSSGDLIVWRRESGTWFWLTSSTNYRYETQGSTQWGASGDTPLLGDLDGDTVADLIIWRPDTATWFYLTSSTGYSYASAGGKPWNTAGHTDIPMTGDMDGDGRADLVLWQAVTGTWMWRTSRSEFALQSQRMRQWGSAALNDVPLIR